MAFPKVRCRRSNSMLYGAATTLNDQPQRKASSSIYKHKGANFRREPATRNDAVDVGVVLQGLAPGMEHGDKCDPGSSRDQATRTLFTGPPGDI